MIISIFTPFYHVLSFLFSWVSDVSVHSWWIESEQSDSSTCLSHASPFSPPLPLPHWSCALSVYEPPRVTYLLFPCRLEMMIEEESRIESWWERYEGELKWKVNIVSPHLISRHQKCMLRQRNKMDCRSSPSLSLHPFLLYWGIWRWLGCAYHCLLSTTMEME